MEATEKRSSPQLRRLLGTRSGTLALAAAAAVLAGVVLIAYLAHYRNSVKGSGAPATVLVAGGLIPKGTSGDVVISDKLFKPSDVAADQVADGAVVNTAALAGRVAARDIYPGEQISATDFRAKADPVRGELRGDLRAVAVPVDTAHGLIGEIRAGDRVDVFGSFDSSTGRNGANTPVLRTMMQNVLVLQVPSGGSSSGGINSSDKSSNVMLRVSDRQAAALAFASDNGKVWFALRAPVGASQSGPATVDQARAIAGIGSAGGSN
jgi:Flp pilus assembly protein CpaB